MGTLPAASRLLAALMLPAWLTATACGGKAAEGENSCTAIGAHFEKLARAEAEALPAGHPEKAATLAAEALLPKLRDNLIKECREDRWPEEVRRCFLGAKDAAGFRAACNPLLERLQKQGVGGKPE